MYTAKTIGVPVPTSPDDIARAVAKFLAPYVAAELRPTGALASPSSASVEYDAATCAEFVRELGTGVLNRAADFFAKLDTDGQVGSLELASLLGTATPRNIPANLTNSLKQRARALGLARPWDEAIGSDDRTLWLDRDGIAARMSAAVRDERQRRFGPRPQNV